MFKFVYSVQDMLNKIYLIFLLTRSYVQVVKSLKRREFYNELHFFCTLLLIYQTISLTTLDLYHLKAYLLDPLKRNALK